MHHKLSGRWVWSHREGFGWGRALGVVAPDVVVTAQSRNQKRDGVRKHSVDQEDKITVYNTLPIYVRGALLEKYCSGILNPSGNLYKQQANKSVL